MLTPSICFLAKTDLSNKFTHCYNIHR